MAHDWLTRLRWKAKQYLAGVGRRYYGDGGTLHHSNYLDVEICDGRVVSVWFRCQPLPFRVTPVDSARAKDMRAMMRDFKTLLAGVEIEDRHEDTHAKRD